MEKRILEAKGALADMAEEDEAKRTSELPTYMPLFPFLLSKVRDDEPSEEK